MRNATAYITKVAVLSAVATVLYFFARFPIFSVPPFNVLDMDFSDIPALIGGFALGPIASVIIAFIRCAIKLTTSTTAFVGELSAFVVSISFTLPATIIYKYKKNIKGAVIGLVSAIFAMTAFMILFNLFIVPIYTPNFTTAAVAKMVPTLFLPFNLTKATLNAALVLILYKPASIAMKAARVLPSNPLSQRENESISVEERKKKNLVFSLVVTAIGLVVAALCVVVFFVFLDGSFSLVG